MELKGRLEQQIFLPPPCKQSVGGGRLLARRPSSRPKDSNFSEMGDFRRPVLGGNLRTSVPNVTKKCV